MKIDYTGKAIAVTGAGGSIGRASATLFASLGGSVLATDINADGQTNTQDLLLLLGNFGLVCGE